MLNHISVPELQQLLRASHPGWHPDAVLNLADTYKKNLDSRLESPLLQYLQTGKYIEYSYGDFSLLEICGLRGCAYIDAVILMDQYMRDPVMGRAKILARSR